MEKPAPKRKMVFYADSLTQRYLKTQAEKECCSISYIVNDAISLHIDRDAFKKGRKHGKG